MKVKITLIFLALAACLCTSLYLYHKHQLTKYENILEKARNIPNENSTAESIQKAIDLSTQAANFFPKYPDAYAIRSAMYFINQDLDKSLADSNLAISLSKDSSQDSFLFYTRGEIYKNQDKLDLAVAEYAKAYASDPTNRDVVHSYVASLINTKENEKAYQIIEKYFNTVPYENYIEDVDLWKDMAFASFLTNRCVEASVRAWHIANRNRDQDDDVFSRGIMHNASMSKTCVKEAAPFDEPSVSTKSILDSVVRFYAAENGR